MMEQLESYKIIFENSLYKTIKILLKQKNHEDMKIIVVNLPKNVEDIMLNAFANSTHSYCKHGHYRITKRIKAKGFNKYSYK